MPHRNTGAPFTREDGTTWETGAVHEATAREIATRAYKLESVGEQDDPPEPGPLDGIEFGSGEAEELAAEQKLTAADFDGRLGTGEGHAFLKADVEAIIEGQGDG